MRFASAQPWLMALLSGACIGITLLPYDVIPGSHLWIFFGYVPLFLAWSRQASSRRIFLVGWLAQIVLSLVAFPWVAFTLQSFAHLPTWLSYLGLLAFAALAYLFIPLAGLIWSLLFRAERFSPGVRMAALVLVFALSERVYPFLFPWHLGSAWIYLGGPAYQAADLIGFQGLSTFTLAANGLIAYAILQRHRGWMVCARPILVGILAYALMAAYGSWRLPRLEKPDQMARILVVQANVGNKQKMQASAGASFQKAIVETYANQSLEALAAATPKPDLVVWAETAYPGLLPPIPLPSAAQTALLDYVSKSKVPLGTGGFGANLEGKITNGFFLLSPDGKSPAIYAKTYLMPFGEHVPGADWFPFLKSIFPGGRDFGRGAGPQVLFLNNLRLGPQICYEDLFDDFARQSADLGAQVLLNITNDSWYGPGYEPLQHLYSVLGRAIETRRPFLRATNTGVTSAILADGTFLPWTSLDAKESRVYELPYVANPSPTIFMRFGYWLVPALLWVALAFCMFRRRRIAA